MRKNGIEVVVHRSGVVQSFLTLSPEEFLDMGEPSDIDLARFNGSLSSALINLRSRSKEISSLYIEPIHF